MAPPTRLKTRPDGSTMIFWPIRMLDPLWTLLEIGISYF
jgi:hypothetical protein